jgi:signal transduction histidine kinase
MRLTKKLETEILKVYYAYWDAYLKGDMKTFASFLDENVTVYGTAAGEVFTNKKEAVKFYTITADQMTGKADFRKRRVKVKTAGNTVVVNEECDLYVLIDGVWTFYDHARITAIIEKKGNAWKCVHQHGSFPDTRTEEGDQIATEKIKKENLQLKEAVKRRTTELEEKNKELEIETALEKVRAVAMSMKRREDMLQICKTISQQLANLGVKEIRNVQTAIFKVPAGTYMNYEYYAKHNKTFITETLYTNHKVARTFAAKMLKGKGEVSITHIKGKEKVKEWLNYQKGTNVFIDTWLNTATSLSYYWYSLGPVALGISTYVPLTKEEQQLFCRFLKVFELAYRRYLDIEKAEAQAREAQIEAALERIRAASLAMRDSSALSTIIFRLYAELTKLDAKLDRCFIMIVNPENKGITWWMAGQEGLLAENGFFVQMNQHPSHLMYLDNCKKRKKKWTYLFEGKEKRDWDRFGFSKTELARLPEPVKVFMASAKKVYLSGSSDQFGSLVTGSFEPLPQEQQEIISRFTIAFNQAYTRFLDLQKAEAQTREAQIEAALERVRAAAMSMHRSEELLNVCEVLYKEIRALGFNTLRNAMINIHNDEKKSFINYDYSDEIGRSTNHLVYNIHPLVEKQIGTIRSADDAFSETYFTGRDLTTWKNFRKRIGEKNDSRLDKNKGLYYYFYSIGIGSIGISTFGPISDEKKALLKRFRNVFALSYQRYFDIAKAEAQAREAQIELALERVRARTMAMQHSEELSETVTVMFEQFKELGEEPERMAIEIVNEKDNVFEIWATQHGGSQLNLLVRLSLDEPHVMQKMYKAWKAKTKSITIDLQGKELEQYFNYLKKQRLPVKRKIFGKRRVQNVATFSKGILTIITPEPRPQETIDLLERFASVFDGTYTRFLDLQKAEAQARESQIQLALERVRARTMAMQNSNELLEAGEILCSEMNRLGIHSLTSGYVLIDEREHIGWNYTPNPGTGKIMPQAVGISHTETAEMRKVLECWKAGEPFSIIEMDEEGTIRHQTFIAEHSINFPLSATELLAISPPKVILHNFNFKEGYILIVGGEKLTTEQQEVMIRFTNVFQQTYTRFLDLQKAEAQAKESQIQLALERVRARTMAMHRSDELREVAALLFEQINSLGFETFMSVIVLVDKATRSYREIVSSHTQSILPQIYNVPYMEDSFFNRFMSTFEEGVAYKIIELGGDEKKEHDKNLFIHTDFRFIPEETKQMMTNTLRCSISCAYMKHGCIAANGDQELSDEQADILQRFAKVFEQTYTRFLDLQNAEAQAREAQIEAALERVRSRTMGMQHSNELQEAAMLLLQQVLDLGVPAFGSGFNIWDEDRKSATAWMAGQDRFQPPFKTSSAEDVFLRIYQADERGEALFVEEQEGEALKAHYDYMNSIPVFKEIADKMAAVGQTFPTFQIMHCAFFSQGYLMFITFEPVPTAYDIFKRFAKVFEQTYTRFLDLQKAEAQAREAQIEAALERVRSQAMAMRQSADLLDIVVTMRNEFTRLGHEAHYFWYMRWLPDKYEKAMTSGDGTRIGMIMELPRHMHGDIPLLANWEKSDEPAVVYAMDVEAAINYVDKMVALGDFKLVDHNAPTNDDIRHINGLSFIMARTLHGEIGYSLPGVVPHPPADDIKTLVRFAGVFDLAYRRFEDLKLAEQKNRETEIELALERTRTQSMLMQRSDELDETLRVFHQQVLQLGIPSAFSFLWLPDEEKDRHIFWAVWAENDSTVFKSKAINYPLDRNEPATAQCLVDWKSKQVVSYHVPAEGVESYFGAWGELIEGTEHLKPEYFREGLYYVEAFIRYGCFGVLVKYDLAEDEKKILYRFAVEFERTYTRFLDLQKAEAQTREALIEGALERVRARALAMQQPEELRDVAQVLRNEMGALGVEELETSSIYIHGDSSENVECWYALQDPKQTEKKMIADHFMLNLDDTWVGREMKKFYLSGEKQTSVVMQGENRKEWINYCYKHSPVFSGFYGETIPDRTYHLYKFSHGYIGAAAPGDISAESWKLLNRAASVFSLAYSRFRDLTQARIDLLRLKEEKQRAESALSDLQATQKQLVQSEKMASLGELTAGIAHEIQNPLNFVNNFSEVSKELLQEMKEAVEKGNVEDAKEIMNDVIQNLEKINHHGKRADGIVKGMLQHSRSSSGQKEMTDINALCDEYLRLAYHGLRAKDKSFNAIFETQFENSLGKINVMPQEIGRVVLNLINNAFYAVSERKKLNETGYEPTVSVSTIKAGNTVVIGVRDNGTGIPQRVLDKIFQPFFTTKPTGLGTGLGLSLSYDIITKGHGGELKVETKEGQGTEFFILLPL